MNINDIINQLAATDADDQLAQKADRRGMLKGFGAKLAVAAVPIALGSLFSNKAYGQSKETIVNVLNYLLKLEQIVDRLYTDALPIEGLAPADFKAQFEQMAAHTKLHIETLSKIIEELGGTVVILDPAKIDLSGGRGTNAGPFYKALLNTDDFLILMQVLTDAGTRIYKGQITEVLSDKVTVRALMTIHSVKARQAAFVRYMRHYWMGADIKPWITGTNSDTTNTAAQRAYAGEGNETHNGINIVGINGFQITSEMATQAFDEPLSTIDGNNIVDRFRNTL